MKKIIACVLTLMMIISAMPAGAAVAEPTVTKVEVEDVYLIENYDGEWLEEYDGYGNYVGEWFCYYYDYPAYITVTFSDGTVVSCDESELYFEYGLSVTYSTNHSYHSQWDLGSHAVLVKIGNVTAKYNAIVVESPVASVKADPVTAIHNSDGYWWDDYDENGEFIEDLWFEYYKMPEHFEVTMKDGTVYSGDQYFILDVLDAWVEFDSDQSVENQWGLGEHKATVSVLGVESEVTVNVIESPVKSIEVEPVVVYENVSGFWIPVIDDYGNIIENGYFNYFYMIRDMRVEFNNGDVFEGTEDELSEMYRYYCEYRDDQSSINQWVLGGEYTIEASFMGYPFEFTVVVEENPVASVEIGDLWLDWEDDRVPADHFDDEGNYVEGSWYAYGVWADDITVTYKSGEAYTGDYISIYEQLGFLAFCISDQSYENQWGLGYHTATAEFMGDVYEYNVIIAESGVKGDVNCDDGVSISDLFELKSILIGDKDTKIIADVSGDGTVNITDLFELKSVMVG